MSKTPTVPKWAKKAERQIADMLGFPVGLKDEHGRTVADIIASTAREGSVLAFLKQCAVDESRNETYADGLDAPESAEWHKGRRELLEGIISAIEANPQEFATSSTQSSSKLAAALRANEEAERC